MGRVGWRYFAKRLVGDGTEVMVCPSLPAEDVKFENVLSGTGGMSFTLEPGWPQLIQGGSPIISQWSTAIYAEYNGQIRGAGIVDSIDFDGPRIEASCVSWTGYADGMPYTGDGYLGVQVEPLDVVRTIWGHIQSQPGGNIGLKMGAGATGKKIGTALKQGQFDTVSGPLRYEDGPYKLNWYTSHDLGAEINKLSKEQGFDYRERHAFNANGDVEHFLDFGAPNFIRRRTDIAFRWGVNVLPALRFHRQGDDYASGVVVLGGGEGAAMAHSIMEPQPRPDDRLRRVVVVQDDRLGKKESLEWRGRAELQWRKSLTDIDTVDVIDHPYAPLGSVSLGDEIRFMGRGEWADLDTWAKVVSISYSPEKAESATYKLVRTDKIFER